jgi:putative DNA primase/helicase
MRNVTEQFRFAIQSAGLHPPEYIEADGKLHRFSSNGRRGDDAGWYVMHGDGLAAGAFGDWRSGLSEVWRADVNRSLMPQDEAAYRARVADMRRLRELAEARRKDEASERAEAIWQSASPSPRNHAYLLRKGVAPHGVRLFADTLTISGMDCAGALVIPLRDVSGHLHSLQFVAPNGEKRHLPGGRQKGCYYGIGEPNDVLVVAEGFATAASIREATGYAVAMAGYAGNLESVAEAARGKFPNMRIVIGADNDVREDGGENAGIVYGSRAAFAVGGYLAVPNLDGSKCDFNDLMLAHGADAVRAAIDNAKQPEGSANCGGTVSSVAASAWAEPRPLKDTLPRVEKFTPGLLPRALRDWVVDVAERAQAPMEYVAVAAMVSAGAALGRKIAVRPKMLDDWHEFPNLWGALIGPPSWMKSPCLDEGKRPLTLIEAELLEDYELTHREWEADAESAKARRDGAKDRARKAARDKKAFDKMELLADIVPDEPQPARLIVNDATQPALCDVLRANPNGVLVVRDELHGFIAELDKDGMQGARGFYLTGWSGKEAHVEDRIARGKNLRVPHVCLSMLGGIQPARVAPLLRDSIATGGSDGFLARFSLAVWPDSPGEYKAIDRAPDGDARDRAYKVFRDLYVLTPQGADAEGEDDSTPFVRFEPAAGEMFTEWDVALRNRARSGGDDGAFVAHLLKYPKTVAGLALIIHLSDGGRGSIGRDAVRRALGWAELLESHARRIYSSLGQSHIDAARSLLTRLKCGDLETPFTVRDIYRRNWAHLPDAEAAHAAVDVLEAHHCVRALPMGQNPTGGRPSVAYEVNPAIRS